MARAAASIDNTNDATAIATGRHRLVADEGPQPGGKDSGPGPYDPLVAALGSGTVIKQRTYAERTPVASILKRGLKVRTTLA